VGNQFNLFKTANSPFFLVAALFLVPAYFHHVHLVGVVPYQVTAEIIRLEPEKVLGHVAETVPLARENEEIETLVGLDQGVGQADGIAGMHIVVDVAGTDQQAPLEIAGYLGVLFDVVLENDISFVILDFPDPVVPFAPPAVVDVVFVVAGRGYGHLEKVGINQHGRS